jgi:NADH-quinone oxidoreductase subunit N
MNTVQDIDWLAVAPPLILAGAAILVLLSDAFLGPARNRNQAHGPAALTVLAILAAGVTAATMWDDPRSTFCIVRDLDGPVPCSFEVDQFTLAFWAITLFGTAVVALIGTVAIADGRTPPGEWNFLLLSSATGALVIAASRDLITLVIALEVVSLPAFAMAGLRYGDRRASEASLKFFLVSVISTAVMLMGISLVYGVTGSVFFDQINTALSTLDPDLETVAIAASLLTVVGLAFKVAAVPFHMWVPDTYVGAPVAVAAYLSVVSKAAGFVGLMLVLTLALPAYAEEWSPVVAVLAALTMTVGNVLALRQTHAVRLLAWSSVAQAGYILVPFGTVAATGVGEEVLGASIGYLAIYAFVNLGAFAVAALVGTRHEGQQLEDYRGLVRGEPGAGWALAFALVALAGLPPGIVGLMAKVVVFDVAAGPTTWLAIVMAVNVAIGLVYYVRWLMILFTPAEEEQASVYDVPTGVGIAIGVTLTAGVVFSVFPGWLLDNAVTVLG